MTRRLMVAGLLVLACATARSGAAQTPVADPMVGTWKLNVEKSTFNPGPGPMAATSQNETRPDGYTRWVRSNINAAGNPTFNFSLRRYDGRDYPTYNVTSLTALVIDGDATPNTTQASRVIDGYTVEVVNKTDGVVNSIVRRTMARDGKTYTLLETNATGEVTATELWEKMEQPPQP